MRTLYCLVMLVLCVFATQKMFASGHDVVSMLMVFATMGWLAMFLIEMGRACPALADRLIQRAMRTPYTHLTGYMERYWLFRLGRRGGGQSGPYPLIGARVHHILRSDHGRDFHDHPWPYLTIILRGGYYEVRPLFDELGLLVGETRTWYGPGNVLLRRAGSWHRLELPAGKTAWTLFCTGPKTQPWGFLTPKGKVYWREYLRVPAGVGED